jgi:endonuclease/exonuclease/phosphatase family metal-dependent hydrolase
MRLLTAVLAAVVVAGLTLIPASAEATGQQRELAVLTYNMHHGQGTDGALNLERTAQVIESSGAEVIALQEVDKNFDPRSNWVDQPAWLAQRLGMQVSFAANLDWDPPAPGQPRRQYGTAVLSRHPIVASRNTFLPLYPGQEQRSLLEVTVDVGGTPVRIANTHLTNDNDAERQEQADKVVELLAGSSVPTVLAGDLNATPTAPPIKTLTAVFADSWTEAGSGAGYTYHALLPTKRIDYLLHSAGVTTAQIRVIRTLASDHLPVLAQLSVG